MLYKIAVAVVLATALPLAAHAQSPTLFGNPLSASPPSGAASDGRVSRSTRSVEAEGLGRSEIEARRAAVSAAVEQAVGVYIDSRRRSETNLTDDKLHQIVEEKIQTFSSAFVDRVETIASRADPQGGFVVRIRAEVQIPDLISAMRQADLPVTPIDVASNEAKLSTQAQMQEDASALAASALRDLSRSTTRKLISAP
jgi:ribosomal protein L13E